MNYKIQVTVDEELNATIKARAKQMGLSVSSYARFALLAISSQKNKRLLDQAMDDVEAGHVEKLNLS